MPIITSKPHWPNKCNHGQEEYVGSISYPTITDHKAETIKYDVYAFADSYHGQHICIRFGDECREYYSPGSIAQMATGSANFMPYRYALQVLEHFGHIKFSRKTK